MITEIAGAIQSPLEHMSQVAWQQDEFFSWDCVELYRVLIQVPAGFCGRQRLAGQYGNDKYKEQLLMLSSATRLIRRDSVLKK